MDLHKIVEACRKMRPGGKERTFGSAELIPTQILNALILRLWEVYPDKSFSIYQDGGEDGKKYILHISRNRPN